MWMPFQVPIVTQTQLEILSYSSNLLFEAKEYLLFAAAAIITAQREHTLSEHVEQ